MPKAKTSVFDERYARLNPRQKEAVDTIEGPVMVIAGPGTGKTTILTLRIANILRLTDTPASGILAITYTEAAAAHMKEALRGIVGSRADEVRIHTFHGFAASLIAEFPEHFPSRSRARQATDAEIESILRAILADEAYASLRPIGAPDLYLPKIVDAISKAKREAWTPDMLAAHARSEAQRITDDPASISTRGATKGKLKAEAQKEIERAVKTELVAGIYATYEKHKRDEHLMDYDDLLSELLRALREDELFLRLVQEKFLYISVDEHQDTNDVQNAIVRSIAEFFDDPNLFIVGDEKQAIFRFQGASVENFLKFQNAWKSMRVIALSDNYRSHQGILDAGFSLIEKNYREGEHEALRVRLASGRDIPVQSIDVIDAGNMEAMYTRLVGDIHEFSRAEPHGTIAVIARRNRDVSKAAAALEAAGISIYAERGADILKHPVGILFFRLVEAFGDPSRTEAFAATLAGGLWDVSFAVRSRLIRDIRAGRLDDLEREISVLTSIHRDLETMTPLEGLLRLAQGAGLVSMAIRDPLSAEVWRALVAVSARLVQEGSLESPRVLFESLLSYERTAESRGVKVPIGLPDARVSVMTAHGSKGLEFDRVFIINASEDAWVRRNHTSWFSLPGASDDEDHIRDARRLFYVALTRARNHATILCPMMEDDGRALIPVRFIGEMDEQYVRRETVPAQQTSVSVAQHTGCDAIKKRQILEYIQRHILERGVSPSALNDFIACPSSFYLKHVLGLPEVSNPKAEKGNALHAGISSLWKADSIIRSDAKQVASALQESVRMYLETSPLPVSEKQAIQRELDRDIPHIAVALVSHFAGASPDMRVLNERRFESSFSTIVGEKSVAFPLHGKLDTLIASGEVVQVFDYKAREAMSEAAIKGETKDASGDYFRQLVFYTMLVRAYPEYRNKRIETSLMFIQPDSKGVCRTARIEVGVNDIQAVEQALQTLAESAWSGTMLASTCTDPECSYCPLLRASTL